MLITVANNKGGQGKTLLATLLAQYLASNPENVKKVFCLDLDRTQQHFIDNMAKSGLSFVSGLDSAAKCPLCVVDTPPSLDDDVIRAVKMADVLVVPVVPCKHSAQNAANIAEIRERRDGLRVVLNQWDASLAQKQARSFLNDRGFRFYGIMPKYKRVAHNIDAGLDWRHDVFEEQTLEIIGILKGLLSGPA
ncbi:MAG: ParA family protein [Synergistaceae bacterium]|jgi:cellulose biosynthesis protein BcsQ|nr:ParA family protein [Synergistaceae bacterium]